MYKFNFIFGNISIMQKISFIFLLFPILACAQNNSFVLWNDNSSFLYYKNNSIQLRNLENEILHSYHFSSDINKDDIFFLVDNNHYTFFDKNKDVNIVSKSGGMYYKSFGDTILRFDNSFNHKMTSFSDVFIKNDTIFKYGGYGYWSNRNSITYFDNETKEWEFYKINPPKIPPSLAFFSSSMVGDNYYVYAGYDVDPFSGSATLKNNDVWSFNFKTKAWNNLGISNIPYFSKKHVSNLNSDLKLIGVENSESTDLSRSAYCLVSFTDNKIRYVNKNKTSFNLNGNQVFFVGDTIFNINHNDRLISSTISGMFDIENPVKTTSIYINTNVLYNELTRTAIVSIVIIFILIVFLRFKRNQRPRISDFGVRYKGISYSLKTNEKKILQLVLSNKEVPSQQMFDAVEDKSLSYPQNNKIKNDIIRKVNKKIYKILDIEDFIESKKLVTDGRVLIYFTKHAHLFEKNS